MDKSSSTPTPFTAATYHASLERAEKTAFASTNAGPTDKECRYWFQKGHSAGVADCLEAQAGEKQRLSRSVDGVPESVLREGAALLSQMEAAYIRSQNNPDEVQRVLRQFEAYALELVKDMVVGGMGAPGQELQSLSALRGELLGLRRDL